MCMQQPILGFEKSQLPCELYGINIRLKQIDWTIKISHCHRNLPSRVKHANCSLTSNLVKNIH